jgi:hypothetical protein
LILANGEILTNHTQLQGITDNGEEVSPNEGTNCDSRQENNIKMDLEETGCGGRNWIPTVQDSVQ